MNTLFHRIIVGDLKTNCYIVQGDDKSAIVIDPGADGEKIEDEILSLNLSPVAVILTHGHYDHIGAANFVAEIFNIPIFAGRNEIEMLENPEKNFSAFVGEPISVIAKPLKQSQLQKLNIHLRLLELPGHTSGSIGLLHRKFLISGDVVFAGGGVGRTDIPGGNSKELAKSIEKILKLPDALILLPGHGGRSIIGKEKAIWKQGVKMLLDDLL